MRPREVDQLLEDVEALLAGDGGRRLHHSERAVLRVLASRARDGGVLPWPVGTAHLARATGYTPRQVRRCRRSLESIGLIEVIERGDGAQRTRYRVVIPQREVEVHPCEQPVITAVNERDHPGETAPVPGSPCPPPGVTVSPPGGRHVPPYTRARPSMALSGVNPLTPTGVPPAGGPVGPPQDAPDPGGAASRAAAACPKARARGRPCRNCRACGTTSRQLAAAARKAAAAEASRARIAAQLAARAAAASDPGPTRDPATGRAVGYLAALEVTRGVASARRDTSDRKEADHAGH